MNRSRKSTWEPVTACRICGGPLMVIPAVLTSRGVVSVYCEDHAHSQVTNHQEPPKSNMDGSPSKKPSKKRSTPAKEES